MMSLLSSTSCECTGVNISDPLPTPPKLPYEIYNINDPYHLSYVHGGLQF